MGCVAGMSQLAYSPSMANLRVSIGLGYGDYFSVSTMIHEVGHAHGRNHSPCGLQGQPADPQYPYSEAKIGVWGYDILNESFMNPESNIRDFMSYCQPYWVSDYTYKALFNRIVAVNALAYVYTPSWLQQSYASINIDLVDGFITKGPTFSMGTVPFSPDERTVDLLDGSGNVISTVSGYYHPYSHPEIGGQLIYPEPADNIVLVRTPGFSPVKIH
jgi:hypothetical protein